MISAWWLIPIILAVASMSVAAMALLLAGSRAEDIDEAYREGFMAGAAEAAKDIDKPRSGRWDERVQTDESGKRLRVGYQCTACGRRTAVRAPYCPACGARMGAKEGEK